MKFLYMIALSIFAFNAYSIDTTITVLGVITNGANTAQAERSLRNVVSAYNGSQNSSVGIRLANSGNVVPVADLPPRGINNIVTFNVLAAGAFGLRDARGNFNADVVLIFTGGGQFSGGLCGLAGLQQPGHWIDAPASEGSSQIADARFVGGRASTDGNSETGLDLFGAEVSYFATIAQGGDCEEFDTISATHEFGHLFGAGHLSNEPSLTAGTDSWLQTNSHASLEIEDFSFFNLPTTNILCVFSAVSTGTDLSECSPSGPFVNIDTIQVNMYSNGNQNFSQDNSQTIRTTRLSVANYRQEILIEDNQDNPTQCSDGIDNDNDGLVDLDDGDCTFANSPSENGTRGQGPMGPVSDFAACRLSTPTYLVAELADGNDCNLSRDTAYIVKWSAGSLCPVSNYNVFGLSPNVNGFLRIDATGVTQGVYRVRGTAGSSTRLRVSACNLGNDCTALTPEEVRLVSLCY